MFAKARNTVINGGTFTIHHASNEGRKLMELLQQHISPGAFHNSDERYDAPKCHPRTRRAVLKKIIDWAKDANKVALFLWLYGPAGAGKSAIMQTIAELLEEAGLLAAAFFFSRNAAGRNDKTPLVATLVYQLVKSIPEICAGVLEAVERDPALFSYSIQAQIQALVVEPLNALAPEETPALTLLSRPRLIILDGLDECHTTSAQTQILNALSTAVKRLKIPLFFLIASRPEQHIRQAFNDQEQSLCLLSFSIALDDTYQPDDDIRVFLQSTFDEIKRNHPSKAHLPASWPSSEDIQRLVNKSSGQFIFASTVAKYVNSHRHWPPDRLEIIFKHSDASQETPFAELDSLYRLILLSVADTETLQDVLMVLVLRPFQCDPQLRQTRSAIENLLFYRPGEIDMILTDLHSIIYVPPPGNEVEELRFFHASLPDFLLIRSRSMDLFLDPGAAYAKLTGLAMKHINSPTESPLGHPKGQYNAHCAFRFCCVNARLSPQLLEDLCRLNLAAHLNDIPPQFVPKVPELMYWFGRQWLNPNGTETLLDHHLATFDEWLQAEFMSSFSSSRICYYLTAVTLLDQLDPKECNWHWLSEILQVEFPIIPSFKFLDLFGGAESQLEISRIVSTYLMDQKRAQWFWVNSQKYADLARYILEFLRDKRFVDIVDVHTVIPLVESTTYYEVGKLAFNLLPILLSRIKALGGSQVHEITVLLPSHPAFYLIENDPLEFEKVKAAQAVKDFLKKKRSAFKQRFTLSTPSLLPW